MTTKELRQKATAGNKRIKELSRQVKAKEISFEDYSKAMHDLRTEMCELMVVTLETSKERVSQQNKI